MSENFDRVYIHGLVKIPGLGPATVRKLLTHFQDAQKAFYADEPSLRNLGVKHEIVSLLVQSQNTFDPARELEELAHEDIVLVCYTDTSYPALLREIAQFPPLLYVRGKLPGNSPHLAVVGSRKPTQYGIAVLHQLLPKLAHEGVVLVSGLALGIDKLVHEITLAELGSTVAVLGCGLDTASIYPQTHASLAMNIVSSGGCLISEFAPGTPAFKQNFIARNRIISGLSVATMIVEAATESGSLITAKYALEQNRKVLAVPGPITSENSAGTNNLLKLGAIPITSSDDCLYELDIEAHPDTSHGTIMKTELSEIELEVLSLLTQNPNIHVGIHTSERSSNEILSTITHLEIKGIIKNTGAGNFVLTKIVQA